MFSLNYVFIMIWTFVGLYIGNNTFRMREDINLLKLIDQSKIEKTEYVLSKYSRKLVFPPIPSRLNGRLVFHTVVM